MPTGLYQYQMDTQPLDSSKDIHLDMGTALVALQRRQKMLQGIKIGAVLLVLIGFVTVTNPAQLYCRTLRYYSARGRHNHCCFFGVNCHSYGTSVSRFHCAPFYQFHCSRNFRILCFADSRHSTINPNLFHLSWIASNWTTNNKSWISKPG